MSPGAPLRLAYLLVVSSVSCRRRRKPRNAPWRSRRRQPARCLRRARTSVRAGAHHQGQADLRRLGPAEGSHRRRRVAPGLRVGQHGAPGSARRRRSRLGRVGIRPQRAVRAGDACVLAARQVAGDAPSRCRRARRHVHSPSRSFGRLRLQHVRSHRGQRRRRPRLGGGTEGQGPATDRRTRLTGSVPRSQCVRRARRYRSGRCFRHLSHQRGPGPTRACCCRCWPYRRPSTSRLAMAWRCPPGGRRCASYAQFLLGPKDRRSSQRTDSARRERAGKSSSGREGHGHARNDCLRCAGAGVLMRPGLPDRHRTSRARRDADRSGRERHDAGPGCVGPGQTSGDQPDPAPAGVGGRQCRQRAQHDLQRRAAARCRGPCRLRHRRRPGHARRHRRGRGHRRLPSHLQLGRAVQLEPRRADARHRRPGWAAPGCLRGPVGASLPGRHPPRHQSVLALCALLVRR